MRVCDWIAGYLYSIGVNSVHGLMGGGASGLNDGFIKHGKINYICYHHEQGAGHAAVGEAKFTGQLAVVNPTTGCAGTNCATSVLNAWQDSVPVLFLSGNVRLNTCSRYINQNKNLNLRKYGIQEHDVVETFKSMTKMSVFIDDVSQVAATIQEAVYVATTGRPGPVWIDIPGDIQTALMPKKYSTFNQPTKTESLLDYQVLWDRLKSSNRPLVLAGYGIRQSGTTDQFRSFIEINQIPFVSTYGARDYLPDTHPLNVGTVGIKGSRAGNFALQNADLLIILGSSMGASVIGYDPQQFSPCSFKILVDIDNDEIEKDIVKIDKIYRSDLRDFFGAVS
jgi:acetolactate synthase-1/2/3 large subunit